MRTPQLQGKKAAAGTVLVVVAALAACSSTTTVNPGSPCVTPAASYVVHLVEKAGGTCGAVADSVANTLPDGTFQTPAGCSGTRTINDCSVTISNYSCTPANGVTTTESGQVNWSPDGASGNGTVQVQVASKTGTCSSSYVVTYTRQ